MTKRTTVQNQIDMKFWRLVITAIGMFYFQLIDHSLLFSKD